MQFGKDFDHWPTILAGPIVKILGGGGAKKYSGPPTKIFGGPWPPWPPGSATPGKMKYIWQPGVSLAARYSLFMTKLLLQFTILTFNPVKITFRVPM